MSPNPDLKLRTAGQVLVDQRLIQRPAGAYCAPCQRRLKAQGNPRHRFTRQSDLHKAGARPDSPIRAEATA